MDHAVADEPVVVGGVGHVDRVGAGAHVPTGQGRSGMAPDDLEVGDGDLVGHRGGSCPPGNGSAGRRLGLDRVVGGCIGGSPSVAVPAGLVTLLHNNDSARLSRCPDPVSTATTSASSSSTPRRACWPPRGPSALSTRRVAAEVGTSTTAIYSLIGSKEELVRQLYLEGFRRLDAHQRAVAADRRPAGRPRRPSAGPTTRARSTAPTSTTSCSARPSPSSIPTPTTPPSPCSTLEMCIDAVQRCVDAGLLDRRRPTRSPTRCGPSSTASPRSSSEACSARRGGRRISARLRRDDHRRSAAPDERRVRSGVERTRYGPESASSSQDRAGLGDHHALGGQRGADDAGLVQQLGPATTGVGAAQVRDELVRLLRHAPTEHEQVGPQQLLELAEVVAQPVGPPLPPEVLALADGLGGQVLGITSASCPS